MFDIDKKIFSGLNKGPKKQREYRHPILRSLKGQNLCVKFTMVDKDHYETAEFWRPLNKETLMGLGYLPATGYKTGEKHIFTKTYVKFEGFEMLPCVRVGPDGEAYEVNTLETASTLYDYFTSHAEQDFMEGMRAKAAGSISNKKLLIYVFIIIGIIIGGYLFAHGGV